ncbi:hypothetical protein [Roseburia hominis]
MRVGLYGMPTAGKTFIMDQIDFLDVLVGSGLLREYAPDFDKRDEAGREEARKAVANICKQRDQFIMDGHYAFGDETVFTDEEGEMYDQYLYLYIDPEKLKSRMEKSEKNKKYLKYNLVDWQEREIEGLRNYCHKHNKDFYVIDNPVKNEYADVEEAILFLKDIVAGYSNVNFARKIANFILQNSLGDVITLVDGDKTYIREDSSNVVFDYRTHLFDGNFYSGFQSWKQYREFETYDIDVPKHIDVHKNPKMPKELEGTVYILSSGNKMVWERLAQYFGLKAFAAREMSAETKYFVTKFLREQGKRVIAYGDSMSDLFMLQEAAEGYLISKEDGRISRSLAKVELGGVTIV